MFPTMPGTMPTHKGQPDRNALVRGFEVQVGRITRRGTVGVMELHITRSNTPARLYEQLRAHARVEDELIRDALSTLDQEPPASKPASRPGFDATPIPIGSQVHLDRSGDAWTVLGVADGDLALARRADDGGIERASAPFAAAAEHTRGLLAEPMTADGRRGAELVRASRDGHGEPVWMLATEHETDGIRVHGMDAGVTMVEYGDRIRSGRGGGDVRPARTFDTTWGDILRARGVASIEAAATQPGDWTRVAALRDVVGDSRIVTSSLGIRYGDRTRVIGTDGRPAAGAALLHDADDTQRWFSTTAGLDVWRDGRRLVLNTDRYDHLVHASAYSDGRTAVTNEGPRDPRTRQAWLGELRGDHGRTSRRADSALKDHALAIRTHEAGHVAHADEWGQRTGRIGVASLAVDEEGIVGEAFADLFGAARAGSDRIGLRELGRLQHEFGTLDRLRADGARAGVIEVHTGTQLVTRPMVGFARTHGWDAVAELTGAATRAIGRDLARGEIAAVGIPHAASALHEAAAWRFGADAPAVRALREGWRELSVPLRALR